MLEDAASVLMISMVPMLQSLDEGQEPTEDELTAAREVTESVLAQYSADEKRVLWKSIDRLRECATEIGLAEQASQIPVASATEDPAAGSGAAQA